MMPTIKQTLLLLSPPIPYYLEKEFLKYNLHDKLITDYIITNVYGLVAVIVIDQRMNS